MSDIPSSRKPNSRMFPVPAEIAVPLAELQKTVGITSKSSILSKTIKFIRTHLPVTPMNNNENELIQRIHKSMEMQRKKIKFTQNKLKQAQQDKEQSNKDVLSTVNLKRQQLSEVRLKKLEDKLLHNQERLRKQREDSTRTKAVQITELFKQISESKEDRIIFNNFLIIPIPGGRANSMVASEPEGGLFSLTDVGQKKEGRRFKKAIKINDQYNPHDIHGTREMWEKIIELTKSNQFKVSKMFYGIEKTPIYQLQMEEGTQSKQKNNDFNTRLFKGEFIYKGKINKLNFINMFEELDNLKNYKPRIERVDPVNNNLLSHKLAKAMESAGQLWGQKDLLRNRAKSSYSLNSFEKSMEEFLDESRPQIQEDAQRPKQKFVFTKQHRKIMLT